MWLIALKEENCRASCVCISSSRSRCGVFIPGVLACVHMYILCVCVCMCVCVYVYRHACMYVFSCACVNVFVCMYIHVYMCVYAYLCIGCESQYPCLCVLDGVMMRVCIRVHMYAGACVCVYVYMCIFLQ